jgi:cytochrome c551/c552
VPYGRAHTNPSVTGEPAWDSAATRELAAKACFDCHSNETTWPWYSNIAPISWRLQNHVDEGREKLNFSEWGTGEQETEDIVKVVREGEMPPWDYLIPHPEARLSDADTQTLLDGLGRTFGAGVSGESDESDED